ncbi:Lebercilin-like protein [Frankliniella fusca]|uniref:Lebercilin-like protein n=1 Tax=Frankliniella fusca TaxID=407009 RepID=A0AAE1HSL1_9NEOP|nr:Lebercilin-like protein [Frankliniella fusca]
MQRKAAENGDSKSPLHQPHKALTVAQGSELSKQISDKPARQNKTLSATATAIGSVSCKKRLKGHYGLASFYFALKKSSQSTLVYAELGSGQGNGRLDLHPYQSSHPNHPRLDLNVASKDNLSSFTQRVMSAKLLRFKQLQNQLSEAHLQLNELCTENRLLRSLQKRQDLALDRYEGTQAQLPQLVRSHQEEVRVLRTKYKTLKQQFRSVTHTLKEREMELQNLKEQHAHLLKLSKDRCLGEREALTNQITELKMTVENQASTIQMLNRKVLLETKNLKFQLQQEMQKHKTTQSELEQTFVKMEQLQMQLDHVKERSNLPSSMDRFAKSSSSTLKLPGGQKTVRGTLNERNLPISRFKRTSKESGIPISSNNTDPSSVVLDSSTATYSEKTNEFSTSLDSSPEHTVNKTEENKSMGPSNRKPNTYQFLRDVKKKEISDFNINIDTGRVTDTSSSFGTVCNEVLEREYEDAVAMLSELSSKHGRSFQDDISTSLASLDFKTAKHVASLANATFALKGESQQPKITPTKTKQDGNLVPVKFNLLDENTTGSSYLKSKQESSTDDNIMIKESELSETINSQKESNAGKKGTLESVVDSSGSSDGFLNTKEPFSLITEDLRHSKSTEEEIEASHKEALLKALKAIDDTSNRENNSDDSDSAVIKLTPGTTRTQHMFSSVNSSGIEGTMRLGRGRKPFK